MTANKLPQSSKKVMKILDSGCAMTQKDLVKKTSLHPRTVRYALKKLKERELLIEKLKMNDLRQILYQIRLTGIQKPPMVKPDIFCHFQEHNVEMTRNV
jgi:DNA-binding MarR family transcriptional regulator